MTYGSLREEHPEIARKWHKETNGEPSPEHVRAKSNAVVWWRCRRGHEWQAKVSHRTSGSGCPFCLGRLATLETSLAALHPKLVLEWHPTKNAGLSPYELRPGSGKKVWWRCSFSRFHEWEARIYSRTGRGTGCPHCNREQTAHKRRRRRYRMPLFAH